MNNRHSFLERHNSQQFLGNKKSSPSSWISSSHSNGGLWQQHGQIISQASSESFPRTPLNNGLRKSSVGAAFSSNDWAPKRTNLFGSSLPNTSYGLSKSTDDRPSVLGVSSRNTSWGTNGAASWGTTQTTCRGGMARTPPFENSGMSSWGNSQTNSLEMVLTAPRGIPQTWGMASSSFGSRVSFSNSTPFFTRIKSQAEPKKVQDEAQTSPLFKHNFGTNSPSVAPTRHIFSSLTPHKSSLKKTPATPGGSGKSVKFRKELEFSTGTKDIKTYTMDDTLDSRVVSAPDIMLGFPSTHLEEIKYEDSRIPAKSFPWKKAKEELNITASVKSLEDRLRALQEQSQAISKTESKWLSRLVESILDRVSEMNFRAPACRLPPQCSEISLWDLAMKEPLDNEKTWPFPKVICHHRKPVRAPFEFTKASVVEWTIKHLILLLIFLPLVIRMLLVFYEGIADLFI